MREQKNMMQVVQKNSVLTSLTLFALRIAQFSGRVCILWIFGQEDMPEELI